MITRVGQKKYCELPVLSKKIIVNLYRCTTCIIVVVNTELNSMELQALIFVCVILYIFTLTAKQLCSKSRSKRLVTCRADEGK
jgi:RsiW-degrading membrane proteinase PrsW (M82 family)